MLKFGNNNIGKVFFGANEIGKAYLGSNLVWQSGGSWGQLERHETVTASITDRHLSSYDTEDYSYNSLTDPANAYTSSTSTYAEIGMTTGASAETYIYFKWDTSDIPDNATINSVSCTVRNYISNTTAANVASRSTRLYSGTTAKGSSVNVTSATADRAQTVGTWTREELRDIRLRVYGKRGTSNTTSNYRFRIYYGKLSVNYTYEQYYYTIKVKNNVSGLIVTPGEYEYEAGQTANVQFSGMSSGFIVKDNGVDVTSQLALSGGYLVYTIQNIDKGHRIECLEA